MLIRRVWMGSALRSLAAVGSLVLAAGCADLKRPRMPIDGPAGVPAAGIGGIAGGVVGPLAGGGGSAVTPGRPPTVTNPPPHIGDPFPESRAACFENILSNGGSFATAKCAQCLCSMKPQETSECTPDCWRLASCIFGSGCATADVTCIVAACTDDLGGSARLAAAGTLARATPFTQCQSECVEPRDARVIDDFDGSTR